jgi:hypothetical protein
MARIGGFLSRTRRQVIRCITQRVRKEGGNEQGAAIVEMALASAVLFTLLVGIIQVSMALYIHNFVSEAAREGTRYAVVRGASSCLYATSAMPDCNLGPTTSGNPIQAYLRGLGFPYSSGVTATATWWSPTGAAPNQWTLSCTTATDANATSPLDGDACNYPGHAVRVQVTYSYPLAVPFWGTHTLNISSTSQMIINE